MRTLLRGLVPALIILLLFLISGSWAAPEPGEPSATPEELALGEKVYTTHCKSCHLDKGRSRIKKLNLSDDRWVHGTGSVDEIAKIVSEGIEASQMQPFGSKLSSQELLAVSKYVKTLSQTETASAN